VKEEAIISLNFHYAEGVPNVIFSDKNYLKSTPNESVSEKMVSRAILWCVTPFKVMDWQSG